MVLHCLLASPLHIPYTRRTSQAKLWAKRGEIPPRPPVVPTWGCAQGMQGGNPAPKPQQGRARTEGWVQSARPVGGEADPETVQWTVFPPNALRPAQGREIGRCPVKETGRFLVLMSFVRRGSPHRAIKM